MKNQHGFAMLLVLLLLMLLSMLLIHMLSIYENEKQFLELEQENYRLDQLILNSQLKMIDVIQEDDNEKNLYGKWTSLEGDVYYEVETTAGISTILLRVESIKGYKKQVIFSYNLEENKLTDWTERNFWY